MRRISFVVATGAIALTGCASQVAALAPVGGDDITSVRIAAIDVLMEQKLTILEAPVCTPTPAAVTCTGSLTDGSVVLVTAPGTGDTTMTVTVSGDELYSGPIQDVLERAAEAES